MGWYEIEASVVLALDEISLRRGRKEQGEQNVDIRARNNFLIFSGNFKNLVAKLV
jgi:hypothetical protein